MNLPQHGFAFQPIVDRQDGSVFAYEALLRGPALDSECAYDVLTQVPAAERERFDSCCRTRAIELATQLGMRTYLSINASPSALLRDETGLDTTLRAARECGFPVERLVVEITESDLVGDYAAFAHRIKAYRRQGLRFAIDDFGAGYSGLNFLAEFQPDFLKIDLQLARNVHRHGPRQAIVRAIIQLCIDLGIDVIAEGVEYAEEVEWFGAEGVTLFQGFFFGKGTVGELRTPSVEILQRVWK